MDDADARVGITATVSLEDAAQRLGHVLRMTVTDQGAWAHGYRTFHGLAIRDGARAQFWVTPNEVPRGFVRADDPDYVTLVGSLPGIARRYPEHPDCTLLVSGSENCVDELLAACQRASLSARVLAPTTQ